MSDWIVEYARQVFRAERGQRFIAPPPRRRGTHKRSSLGHARAAFCGPSGALAGTACGRKRHMGRLVLPEGLRRPWTGERLGVPRAAQNPSRCLGTHDAPLRAPSGRATAHARASDGNARTCTALHGRYPRQAWGRLAASYARARLSGHSMRGCLVPLGSMKRCSPVVRGRALLCFSSLIYIHSTLHKRGMYRGHSRLKCCPARTRRLARPPRAGSCLAPIHARMHRTCRAPSAWARQWTTTSIPSSHGATWSAWGT
jgi:hypothetical protein